MKLLLFDTATLDLTSVNLHLEAQYPDGFDLTLARSLGELQSILSADPHFDAVVIGGLPEGVDPAEVLAGVSSELPMAAIVVITGDLPYSAAMSGVDPARVSLLPRHQLARLPYLLQEAIRRVKRQYRALSEIPDLPSVDEDVHRVISSLTADYIYFAQVEEDGTVEVQYRSDTLVELTGYTHQEINEGGSELLVHPDDHQVLRARRASVWRGESRVDEFRIVTRDGRVLWVRDYARPIRQTQQTFPVIMVGAAQEVTTERILQSRLAAQASILEMIARGEPRSNVLSALNAVIEEHIPDAICSVQLVDQNANILYPEVTSRLPAGYVEAIRQLPIGPDNGACGSAAFTRELAVTIDVDVDPRFDQYRDIFRHYELSAVWSTPIFDATGDVIGTFALYFEAPRSPVDHELALLESAAQIAGIVIDVSERETQRQLAQIQYRTLVEQTPAITVMAAADNLFHLTYLSPQFARFSEIPPQDVLHNPDRIRSFIHPDDRQRFEEAVQRSQETGVPLEIEFRIRRMNGSVGWLQANISLVRDQEGEPLHWLGVMLDVTDRNEAIRQHMESERRYRSLFDENLNSIVIYDYEGNAIDVNPAAERVSGYAAEELIGGPLLWLIAPEERDRAERYFLQARAGISSQFTITAINKQGERVELSASESPVIVNGEIVGVSSIAEDVTERRKLESQLLYQAYHDPLTGLPNRVYFDRVLSTAIETLGRYGELAVLFMDLNNFKVINDSLGHDVGDKYLAVISRLLRDIIPEDATLARFGGDEFTILMPVAPDALEQSTHLADRIIAALKSTVTIDGYDLGTGVSIGIASTTMETVCEPRELIRRADIALYDAKQGRNESSYQIFDERMDEWVFERLWLEGDLRNALPNGEFILHFQPLLDMQTREIMVLEALLRWDHPERGLLLPERFLRIAEETGHIIDIDRWVLESACKQVAEWNANHPDREPLYLGVNMSTRQFWHGGLAEEVLTILEESGLDPRLLCIEITESTMMQDVISATEVVNALRTRGVLIAIDDFGTGYSSLSYLKEFPIDVLKIDRSFISTLGEGEQQLNLVRAIVSMARALDLVVVAEGIENETHFANALQLECDLGQGYYVASPAPFDKIAPVLERGLLTIS